MPIKIPDGLPAAETLERENVFFMTETRAYHQDIRPLHILLVNLMPTKTVTETQFSACSGIHHCRWSLICFTRLPISPNIFRRSIWPPITKPLMKSVTLL